MQRESNIWHGFRLCSPDDLPYIGRVNKYNNLVIATGHGMMGLSLGLAAGKLISEILAETATSMPICALMRRGICKNISIKSN